MPRLKRVFPDPFPTGEAWQFAPRGKKQRHESPVVALPTANSKPLLAHCSGPDIAITSF